MWESSIGKVVNVALGGEKEGRNWGMMTGKNGDYGIWGWERMVDVGFGDGKEE